MQILMTNAIQCVGIVCLRGDEVLLVRRGKPPKQGEWSIPGGRIEYGETEPDAAQRELVEETSVKANIIDKVELVKANFDGQNYDLHDYVAQWVSGDPVAGDDATEAQFFSIADIANMALWSKTVEIIHRAYQLSQN